MTNNRLKHSVSVAEFMIKLATDNGLTKEACQEMFTLGYLHDIGYQFTDIPSEHSKVGGEILKRLGYKYWKEVYYHGNINSHYKSKELDLLNIADLNINSYGENVGVNRRLLDIKNRYGDTSKQYREAIELAKQLKLV